MPFGVRTRVGPRTMNYHCMFTDMKLATRWLERYFYRSNAPTDAHSLNNKLENKILVTHTHIHPFNGLIVGTTRVSRYQKGKTNLDFSEARDSEWQWHQLGHMQVCTSLQTDNHASSPPLSFLQARCPSYGPTDSVKALKAKKILVTILTNQSAHFKGP